MIFNVLELKIILQLLFYTKNISLYQQVDHTLMTEYFNLIHLVNYWKIKLSCVCVSMWDEDAHLPEISTLLIKRMDWRQNDGLQGMIYLLMLNLCIQSWKKKNDLLLILGILKHGKWHVFHLWLNNPVSGQIFHLNFHVSKFW